MAKRCAEESSFAGDKRQKVEGGNVWASSLPHSVPHSGNDPLAFLKKHSRGLFTRNDQSSASLDGMAASGSEVPSSSSSSSSTPAPGFFFGRTTYVPQEEDIKSSMEDVLLSAVSLDEHDRTQRAQRQRFRGEECMVQEVEADEDEEEELQRGASTSDHVAALAMHGDVTQEMTELTRRIIDVAEEEVGPESLEVAELLVQAMESRNMMRADPDRFEHPSYQFLRRTVYSKDHKQATEVIQELRESLRHVKSNTDLPFDPEVGDMSMGRSHLCVHVVDGVYQVFNSEEDKASGQPKFSFMSLYEYYQHHKTINRMATHGPTKTYCHRRLKMLEDQFNIHMSLNWQTELKELRAVGGRDFYNVTKVDNHIHLASIMSQNHLLKFIRRKCREEKDVVVHKDKSGRELTLCQVFEDLNVSPDMLNVDALDVHADKSTFHRFDNFNSKYNPLGEGVLRSLFIKTSNHINGRYFAEISKEVFNQLEDQRFCMSEPRVSVYGGSLNEWSQIASWVLDHKLYSKNVRWMIQAPRIYSILFNTGAVKSFQDLLTNFFQPLFDVTLDPASNPQLHTFLQHVVGIDSVDDESKHARAFHHSLWPPHRWDYNGDPPYSYYAYYFGANLFVLNKLRKERGLNTIAFRPHCGEAGDLDHLASAFLLSDCINHGIRLADSPVLQYLYYLCQIGLSVSPLSNNALFLNIRRNPFPQFFARGLNVTLSTDDPLMFHYTDMPLIEEYSVCSQIFNLQAPDLCEIARNSVLQSGFEDPVKCAWIGKRFKLPGPLGNNVDKTNVPQLRATFRWAAFCQEHKHIIKFLASRDTQE